MLKGGGNGLRATENGFPFSSCHLNKIYGDDEYIDNDRFDTTFRALRQGWMLQDTTRCCRRRVEA